MLRKCAAASPGAGVLPQQHVSLLSAPACPVKWNSHKTAIACTAQCVPPQSSVLAWRLHALLVTFGVLKYPTPFCLFLNRHSTQQASLASTVTPGRSRRATGKACLPRASAACALSSLKQHVLIPQVSPHALTAAASRPASRKRLPTRYVCTRRLDDV